MAARGVLRFRDPGEDVESPLLSEHSQGSAAGTEAPPPAERPGFMARFTRLQGEGRFCDVDYVCKS